MSGFDNARVTSLRDGADKPLPLARLDPRPIGGIYPGNNEDRLLVRLEALLSPAQQAGETAGGNP